VYIYKTRHSIAPQNGIKKITGTYKYCKYYMRKTYNKSIPKLKEITFEQLV